MSPCSDSVSLRLRFSLKLATECKSLTHYTKGTPSPQLYWPSLRKPCGLLARPNRAVSTHCATRNTSPNTIGNPKHLSYFYIREAANGSISSMMSFESRRLRVAPRKNLRRSIKLGLRLFVCMRFQDLFHSPSGVLFAFPSRYWFTIGRSRVFSLGGWSPHLQTGFHVSRPTCRRPSSTPLFLRTGLSPTMAGLSRPLR